LPPPFGVPAPPAAHRVPPAWILTTSAACSARGLGHLAARCGQGSLRFATPPALRLLRDPKVALQYARVHVPFPANAVHTLRSIPLADSRTASLRPLPSCRCRPPLPLWVPLDRVETRPPLWFVTPIARWLHRRDGVADLPSTLGSSTWPPLCTEMPEATTGFHPKSPSTPPRIGGTSRLTSLLTRPEPGLHVASAEQLTASTCCCQPGALCRNTACSLTPRGDRRIRHRLCRPKPKPTASVRTEEAPRHHRGDAANVVPVAR
jgi:hypothetical protein